MIESIEKVIGVVTRDPLTALDAAWSRGQVEQDQTGSIAVKPCRQAHSTVIRRDIR
jgi:RPA family protein